MTRAANYVAVDLGATSGRVIVGSLVDGRLQLCEVHRFENQPVVLTGEPVWRGHPQDVVRHSEKGRLGSPIFAGGREPAAQQFVNPASRVHLHWDVVGLFRQICQGLTIAREQFGTLESIGIDCWGCDYALLDEEGRLLGVPFSYRDGRTSGAAARFFTVLPEDAAYAATGSQVQQFNTAFQLLADGAKVVGTASRMLQLPDLFAYWLTGCAVNETTNASTTGMFDPMARNWADPAIGALEILGLSVRHLLGAPEEPGKYLGPVLPEVVPSLRTAGGDPTPLVLVGSHDTASAVVAVPAQDVEVAYLSSGTWSLVGLELSAPVLSSASRIANFGNELGVDHTVRFLKNVMGLWLLNQSLRTWSQQGQPIGLTQALSAAATENPLTRLIDVNSPAYLAPGNVPSRITDALSVTGYPVPQNAAQTIRCILDSLALAYRRVVRQAQQLSGRSIQTLHVVGGGSRNELLCQLTADATQIPVMAGPIEATAIGNLLVQARVIGGLTGDLNTLREVVRRSEPLRHYTPDLQTAHAWEKADADLLNRTEE